MNLGNATGVSDAVPTTAVNTVAGAGIAPVGRQPAVANGTVTDTLHPDRVTTHQTTISPSKARTTDTDVATVTHEFDRSNFTSQPFDINKVFPSKENTTDVQLRYLPAVTQETVKPHVTEEITHVTHREHHVIHYQTRMQPILEQVYLPIKHYVIVEGKKYEIGEDAVMQHVTKSIEYIPADIPKRIVVHDYVGEDPVVGPISGVGASLVDREEMVRHRTRLNETYQGGQAIKAQIPGPVHRDLSQSSNGVPHTSSAMPGTAGVQTYARTEYRQDVLPGSGHTSLTGNNSGGNVGTVGNLVHEGNATKSTPVSHYDVPGSTGGTMAASPR